jgi:hypothetical protein
MTPSHDEERQGLVQRYREMTDVELGELADDGTSLTDLAREALRAELLRRGLNVVVLESAQSSGDTCGRAPVVIRQYLNVPEALLAKGILDSAGIQCFLADQNIIRLDWFLSNALGGVKLLVKAEDVIAANELLNQRAPESSLTDGDDE